MAKYLEKFQWFLNFAEIKKSRFTLLFRGTFNQT